MEAYRLDRRLISILSVLGGSGGMVTGPRTPCGIICIHLYDGPMANNFLQLTCGESAEPCLINFDGVRTDQALYSHLEAP